MPFVSSSSSTTDNNRPSTIDNRRDSTVDSRQSTPTRQTAQRYKITKRSINNRSSYILVHYIGYINISHTYSTGIREYLYGKMYALYSFPFFFVFSNQTRRCKEFGESSNVDTYTSKYTYVGICNNIAQNVEIPTNDEMINDFSNQLQWRYSITIA